MPLISTPDGVQLHYEEAGSGVPWSGHALNLEEPALFNRIVEDFFHQIETGNRA